MKRALRGPFFLRNIENKLLVDHIKSTNSLFKLRGCFVTAPYDYLYIIVNILLMLYQYMQLHQQLAHTLVN